MLNNMKVLIGLLIVMAGLAYWVSQKDNSKFVTEQILVPSWQNNDSMMTEIDQILLSQGGEEIKLTKQNNNWILNDGFFASIDPLFTMLQGVKNAVIVESKTANPENHARLELAEADLKVNISSKNKILTSLHVGMKTSAGHTFVRMAGENQTYVVKDLGDVTFNLDNWKLKTVLDISADEVESVKVVPKEKTGISIKRATDSEDWELLNVPAGHQLMESAYFDQIGNSLSRLMIDDALPKDLSNMNGVLTNNYLLKNGKELEIKVYQKDEAYFLTVDSEAYLQYSDWMMKIPEYKFSSLNRNLDEYIEPIANELEERVPEGVDPS